MIVDWTRIKLAILKVDLKRFTNEIGLQYVRKTKDDITIFCLRNWFVPFSKMGKTAEGTGLNIQENTVISYLLHRALLFF